RKTKNLLNSSVNEYLLRRRLTKSKHLLLEGLHINEVAEKVGFSSAAYFAAAFKKQFGITPTAFRKDKLKEKWVDRRPTHILLKYLKLNHSHTPFDKGSQICPF